jgi:peptide chain release factor subunit 1
VDSALSDARKRVEQHQLDRDVRLRMREAIDELKHRLRPSEGMEADGARALAAFVAVDGSMGIELLRLPAPVSNSVALDRGAHVEPLIPMALAERWCIALVNRQSARFFLGDEFAVEETGHLVDDVHGWHDQGGWSQRRYQASIEEDVGHHLDRVARALLVAQKQRDLFDRLLLGTPPELRGAAETSLHPDTHRVLGGWVDVDQSSATPETVRLAAVEAIERERDEHRTEALDRLQAGVATEGGHGVHDLEALLLPLYERRVAQVLLDREVHRPGARCPRCGLLGLDPDAPCPVDGAPMDAVEDIVEAGIALAYQQDAEVLLFYREPRLQALGGAGAVLRF